MQQNAQEEQFADGQGEYANLYGGPAYNYLPPVKVVASTIQEIPAPTPDHHRQSASPNLQHAISFNLAANVPELRREAEGLQLAYRQSNHETPATYRRHEPGYTKEVQGLAQAQQYSRPNLPPQGAQTNMYSTRYQHAHMGYSMPSMVPAPVSYEQKHYRVDPCLQQFPRPPTSPTLSVSQQHVHPAFRQSTLQKQLPALPPAPQPLKFQRPSTLPPTPPQSIGAMTMDDALRDQMQTLNMGHPSPLLGKYASGPPKFMLGALARMNTVSSMSSGHSSSTPGSPFDQHHRISAAHSNAKIQGYVEYGRPDLSDSEAHAEVLRLLDEVDEASDRKSPGGASKKGFSLRRSNTIKPASKASYSQDTLANVLENVAEEGSLPMVKAAISLGADPSYRSTGKMKKVKHEALAKATAGGHAKVVNYLLLKGATYGEAPKKSTYTPLDRALLTAVYKGQAELSYMLMAVHGANPMIEQWPREIEETQHYWSEKQVRLSKTSVLDGISHWKNEEQGLSVLSVIMQNEKFDPAAPISGVFDNKSELQSAEFAHRPWNTTYEYSALACFVRAGWAEAVEAMLSIKGSPADYEKEDEVLQYQDKVTRFISPVNALTKDTWDQRPEDALRILRLLIDRGFNIALTQRTANDLGPRTTLGRALAANASQAVELIAQHRPELVKEVISFRHNKKETKAQPLTAAIALEKLDTARVLLRAGAHPRDPAFDMNVLQLCAHQGGETAATMLAEMIDLAPEFTYAVLDIAIRRINKDCVRVLLDSISAAASRNEIAALPAVWDMFLPFPTPSPDSQPAYLELIDMIHAWDAESVLPRPRLPAIMAAIKKDNYLGMEKMLQLGVIDGGNLVLNCKAQPLGEQGTWTVLECAEASERSGEWLGLLRGWGAPLFT